MALLIDNDVVALVEQWVVENGLMNWRWTNGMISKEAHADGLGEHVVTPSFWLGVFNGMREVDRRMESW